VAFDGEAMPKDHEAIQPEKVVLFLRFFLTQNAQGRSAIFYDRANELLLEYTGAKEVISTHNNVVPQPEKEVIELAAQQEERGVTSFREVVNRIRDFSILALYFAVVVDDHFMEITHVIRGEEWISSTPKHLQLYKAFGWEPPAFAHLPLLLNPDKSKLSKRQGDVAVSDYEKKGYLPEALINFVAFLGWNPGDNREIFSLDELIKEFSLEKINKSGAVFNIEKLDWYNKEYIKNLPIDDLVKRSLPWLEQAEFFRNQESRIKNQGEWLGKVLSLEKERVTTLAEFPEAIRFVFELPNYKAESLIWKKGSREEVQKVLPELEILLNTISAQEWNKENVEQKIKSWIVEKGFSNGSVLWPLRVALSGQENSPGPFEISDVLGREEVLKRLGIAIQKIQ
jgi:glutamyl-tRNA synthetase